jgi:hypothetical protein
MKSLSISMIAVWICASGAVAQEPIPRSTPIRHRLHFAAAETGQVVVIVDKKAQLPTVEALIAYLKSLPSGCSVSLKMTDQKFPGGNPFASAIPDLEKVCAERAIKFTVDPPGYL